MKFVYYLAAVVHANKKKKSEEYNQQVTEEL